MSEKTLVEAMAEVSRSFRDFQRVLVSQLLPTFEKLNVELAKLRRDLYLAHLRRWIPFWIGVLLLATALSWWLTGAAS